MFRNFLRGRYGFEKVFKVLLNKYNTYKTRLQQRKQYVFFRCQKCKKNLRLPKNKGKLQGTCPVCGFEFIMKT